MSDGRCNARRPTPFYSKGEKDQSLMGLVGEANLQGTRKVNTRVPIPIMIFQRFHWTGNQTHGVLRG